MASRERRANAQAENVSEWILSSENLNTLFSLISRLSGNSYNAEKSRYKENKNCPNNNNPNNPNKSGPNKNCFTELKNYLIVIKKCCRIVSRNINFMS